MLYIYIYLLYIYSHNQARHCLESHLALLARTAAMISLKECTQEDWLKCWDEGGHTRWHQNEVDQWAMRRAAPNFQTKITHVGIGSRDPSGTSSCILLLLPTGKQCTVCMLSEGVHASQSVLGSICQWNKYRYLYSSLHVCVAQAMFLYTILQSATSQLSVHTIVTVCRATPPIHYFVQTLIYTCTLCSFTLYCNVLIQDLHAWKSTIIMIWMQHSCCQIKYVDLSIYVIIMLLVHPL